jgi:hypothetical protein
MSIKKTETVVEHWEHFCDICGAKTVNKACVICNRDLCSSHIKWDTRDECDDYPPAFCQECWDAGKEIREKMETEKYRYDEKIYDLDKEWKEKALLLKLRNKND